MCTRYPIINRVSESKVHIELTRFVQPEKIEIDANERAVNEKSQYCFFVCTTFDSFLNDLLFLIKSIIPYLYRFFYHFDYTHDLMTSWILAEKEKLPSLDSSSSSAGIKLRVHNIIQYNFINAGSNVIHQSYPSHHIRCFQFLRCSLLSCHFLYQIFSHITSRSINFSKVFI